MPSQQFGGSQYSDLSQVKMQITHLGKEILCKRRRTSVKRQIYDRQKWMKRMARAHGRMFDQRRLEEYKKNLMNSIKQIFEMMASKQRTFTRIV